MEKKVKVTVSVVPFTTFKTTYASSKFQIKIVQSPIIKDYTSASESFSPA